MLPIRSGAKSSLRGSRERSHTTMSMVAAEHGTRATLGRTVDSRGAGIVGLSFGWRHVFGSSPSTSCAWMGRPCASEVPVPPRPPRLTRMRGCSVVSPRSACPAACAAGTGGARRSRMVRNVRNPAFSATVTLHAVLRRRAGIGRSRVEVSCGGVLRSTFADRSGSSVERPPLHVHAHEEWSSTTLGRRPRSRLRWSRVDLRPLRPCGARRKREVVSQDEDLVAFFLSLPKARRRDYEALAELDRRFGEDVEAERRERTSVAPSAERSKGNS